VNKNAVQLPTFKASFLLPKYWPTWLMVGLLYALSWLPYRLQLWLGRGIGRLLFKILPKRVRVARRNLELAFPDKPEAEREQLLRENFANNGIALMETGIAWWWPDWRLKRKLTISGWEHVQQNIDQGRGTFILLFHFLDLEVHARVVGLHYPSIGLYRPHNNAVMEYLQTKGRSRSNKYMIQRKDVRGMIRALNDGEVCGYLPDQDYGRNRGLFVPLFSVPDACTTSGTSIFANVKNARTVISVCERLPKGKGYHLQFYPPREGIPSGDETEDACRVNREVERAVDMQPAMYMWVHRRFKTRPEADMPSYYR
jgi:KDO2-lipid IV(A) lauroyltransferase